MGRFIFRLCVGFPLAFVADKIGKFIHGAV
jgi:hypothetical protein